MPLYLQQEPAEEPECGSKRCAHVKDYAADILMSLIVKRQLLFQHIFLNKQQSW